MIVPYLFEIQNPQFVARFVHCRIVAELRVFHVVVRNDVQATLSCELQLRFVKSDEDELFHMEVQDKDREDLEVIEQCFAAMCKTRSVGYDIGGNFKSYSLENYLVELAHTVCGLTQIKSF